MFYKYGFYTISLSVLFTSISLASSVNHDKPDIGKTFSTVAPKGMFWHQEEDGHTRLRKEIVPLNRTKKLEKNKMDTSHEKKKVLYNVDSFSSRVINTDNFLEELPQKQKKEFLEFLENNKRNIAANFFPEVDERKISIKDLSSKCGIGIDKIEKDYMAYRYELQARTAN